jgi:hypothetical protein
MSKSKLGERFLGHYGLDYVLANLAKPNRAEKQEKKIIITPKKKKMLKRELDERMRIRRERAEQRQRVFFK